MPRLNVYLSAELADRARPLDLNLSQFLQEALRQRLGDARMETWLGRLGTLDPLAASHRRAVRLLESLEPESPGG
ncbi:MAG TPA: type II toxin-antitoxin system CcdA family antitoxin [Candidatus Dormibacteraeota bacterium]|nr:type II toxin-antitoxin system CcdA family antitoxin [Candidatus Dormibacteraeota bacterium]